MAPKKTKQERGFAYVIPTEDGENIQPSYSGQILETTSFASAKRERDKFQVRKSQSGDVGLYEFKDVKLEVNNFNVCQPSKTSTKIISYLCTKLYKPLPSRKKGENLHIQLDLLETGAILKGKPIKTPTERSNFRRDLLDALNFLYRLNFSSVETLKGKKLTIGGIRVIGSFLPNEENKNLVDVEITGGFCDYLEQCNLTQVNMLTFAIGDNGSYLFHYNFSRYFSLPENQVPQAGKILKARIFSVKTAIEWTHTLPTLEEVKEVDRQFTRRIIDPLEKILDDKNGVIESWFYCKAKGVKVTDEELENPSYEFLSNLYIYVERVKGEKVIQERLAPTVGRKVTARENAQKEKEAFKKKAQTALSKEKKLA